MKSNENFWNNFLKIALSYPISFIKNINLTNYKRLIYALKTEPPVQILNNIIAYFVRFKSSSKGNYLAQLNKLKFDDSQEHILFVSHEATYTGAPLIILELAKHIKTQFNINPIFLLCKGGDLTKEFRKVGPTYTLTNWGYDALFNTEVYTFVEYVQSNIKLSKTYINSVESRETLPGLRKGKSMEIIYLIHELGNYYPKNSWSIINELAHKIVFPAKFVQDKAFENTLFTSTKLHIYGQGLLKPNLLKLDKPPFQTALKKQLNLPESSKIVLGCGTTDARKGIDIFVHTAIGFLNHNKNLDTYFVWLGNTNINDHMLWSERDLEQSKHKKNILFVGAKEDTTSYFLGSDIFFLTSRGDPFPCVVHEAMASGLPIICFNNAGGFTEIIDNNVGIICKYGDITDAINAVKSYICNPHLLSESSNNAKSKAVTNFDFKDYAKNIYLNV